MKNTILLCIILMISCTTLKKSERYFYEHPNEANNVAKNYILHNKVKGADICLEAFPPVNVIDTFIINKDSVVINNITDTIYTWFTNTKYVDKEKIRKVLIPCKDSIKIIKLTVFDKRYEVLYDSLNHELSDLNNMHTKVKDILTYTYIWIFILILGLIFYIKLKK